MYVTAKTRPFLFKKVTKQICEDILDLEARDLILSRRKL